VPEFFLRDVMPTVAARFRALSGAQNSALWGDSYAGAAALYIAIERPEIFDRMIIESPSLQSGNGRLLRDSVSLTQLPSRIALGVGTAEAAGIPIPNADAISASAVRLMRTLTENLKAVAYTQTEVHITPPASSANALPQAFYLFMGSSYNTTGAYPRNARVGHPW
jgi:predicted alpha/beta superfamily hydrolase